MASFDRVLALVPERRRPGIKAIRLRIPEVIHDPQRGRDLRGQLAFDPDSGFSIEDPLFRYFLTHMDERDLLAVLGIPPESMESARVYAYDIGFSFAGEVRGIVEAVNDELKSQDIVTFYDFDQQAVLLALDLQPALERIYSESCRYYLVFLETNYKAKVWTRWEQDILINSGRRGHIVPVVLDDEGGRGVVGIPSTVGHINLMDVQLAFDADGAVLEDARTAIRNRCVLPIVEKLDAWVPRERDGSADDGAPTGTA